MVAKGEENHVEPPAPESGPAPEPSEEGVAEARGEQGQVSPPGAEPEVEPEPETDWQEQYDKTRAQLLRVAADFENFKKRSRRDVTDAANRARDEVLQELLPVIDNLERALEHANQQADGLDANTLLDGVRMVLRQFETSMERFEIRGFESVGQPFDPNFHEALQQRESDEVAPGHVLEEFRKGYMMGDRLIRPAMVVVATAPTTAAEPEGDAVAEPEDDAAAEAVPADTEGKSSPSGEAPAE